MKLLFKVKHSLTNEILPIVFKDYETELQSLKVKPVLVGGICVDKCVVKHKLAKTVLQLAQCDDIDVKLTFDSELCDASNNDMHNVFKLRDQLIRAILAKLTDKFIKNRRVEFRLDQNLLYHDKDSIKALGIVSIVLIHDNTTRHILDLSILDCHKLPVQFKAIPFYTEKNGINYATCEFCYIDTVRMMLDRLDYIKTKPSMFAIMKFYRYVLKFMALYVVRNDIHPSLPDNLVQNYKNIHDKLAVLSQMKDIFGTSQIKNITYDKAYLAQLQTLFTQTLKVTDAKMLLQLDTLRPISR